MSLVIPTANPDQLGLFQSGAVDGVWTVEPWVTRLEKEAKARVFLEDKDCITTWLVSSVKFLNDHKDLAKKIVDCKRRVDHVDQGTIRRMRKRCWWQS